jgi:hypothetical protein
LKKDAQNRQRVKLCTSHRVVRCQKFEGANFFSHFRLLVLTTAGSDEGSFKFETESLFEHISFFLELLIRSQKLGIKVRDLVVHITALDEDRVATLQQNVLDRLSTTHTNIIVEFDQNRITQSNPTGVWTNFAPKRRKISSNLGPRSMGVSYSKFKSFDLFGVLRFQAIFPKPLINQMSLGSNSLSYI